MEERADILIWDNLANNLLGAGALETLTDARERLLKPDAAIIPGRVEVCAALAESNLLSRLSMGETEGFDLSPFNTLLEKAIDINQDYILRSKPVTLFDFDFQSGEKIDTNATRQTTETLPGHVNGIVQWLRFHLAEDVVYDTGGEDVYAFGQKLHPITPFYAATPQNYKICGNHDGNSMWLWLEDA